MPVVTRKTPAVAALRLLTAAGTNHKLGALIHSFSLPSIDTCPGATSFCRSLCYATKGHFLNTNVKTLYARNQIESHRRDFAFRMAKEIRHGLIRNVRIHVSGDLYSAAYVRKWSAIIRVCPSVKFFAYTRSWRDPAILPALQVMAALPNMALWYSEDRETGRSPNTPGVRVCFLVHTIEDEALLDSSRHDLVFRDGRHRRIDVRPGTLKRIGGVLVCPHEQNQVRRSIAQKNTIRPPISCSDCRICIRREPSRSRETTNPALIIID